MKTKTTSPPRLCLQPGSRHLKESPKADGLVWIERQRQGQQPLGLSDMAVQFGAPLRWCLRLREGAPKDLFPRDLADFLVDIPAHPAPDFVAQSLSHLVSGIWPTV